MGKKYLFLGWLLTILIAIVWTYENPEKIKKPENALKWINNALKNKDVVMGFGHRVYKSGDSRVPTMREYFKRVAIIKKDKTFEKIYDIVEKVMIKEKNIYPNVDYPTGPTYHNGI